MLMKKILLFAFIILLFEHSNGQCVGDWSLGYLTFEDASIDYNCLFRRDTLSGHVNNWQIGRPGKTVLNSAHSPINVIITDTSNTYYPGDTSTCTFSKYSGPASSAWHRFSGYYYVNSDTLTDFGRLEFSPDNGISWVDILNDTTGIIHWNKPKPVLSGNSNGWKEFDCVVHFDVPGHLLPVGDTFSYRFIFISDTIDTHKDGLMFDDIVIIDVAEGIADNSKNKTTVSLFPNPANDKIHIQNSEGIRYFATKIFNHDGFLIKYLDNLKSMEIDINDLPLGLYTVQFTGPDATETRKFVVYR